MEHDKENDKTLHLPDLHISGFRGIKSLDVNRLGRVTLIAGKNGVGKTTLLDAIRVYAARGDFNLLSHLLRVREELVMSVNEEGKDALTPDFKALRYGRTLSPNIPIVIGPQSVQKQLHIVVQPAPPRQQMDMLSDDSPYIDDTLIRRDFLHYGDEILSSILLRRGLRFQDTRFHPTIGCETVGPGVINNPTMARFWDGIALTDYEDRAVQALQLIYGSEVERLAFIGHETRPGRRAIVKMRSQKSPVSLRSLGDGAIRIFGVALALANSEDGFLLIDEAENGIHHSVQHAYWRMVLETAQKYNVQVLATTHSWDCVRGFAHAVEDSAIKGVFFRMEIHNGTMYAVEYPDESFKIAAYDGTEVR